MNLNFGKHLNLAAIILNSIAIGVNVISGQYVYIFLNAFLVGLCANMLLRMAEKEAIMKHEENKS